MKNIAVLGAGGWGTALALVLARNDCHVQLWGHNPQHIATMCASRSNEAYLPGIALPENIEPVAELSSIATAEVFVVVVPSRALRAVATELHRCGIRPGAPLLSCTKGIEFETGLRMSQVLADALPQHPVGVLSGPSHAEEVARGIPTAVVIGAEDTPLSVALQALFSNQDFRVYTTRDVAGMELGGALKNIYAIAAGVSDGLGLGDNTKSALVTRALHEMTLLGVAMGGDPATFTGLSGIGDLMVTCFSRHSRNRMVGERIGRGESLESITASMQMVAEGVPTTRSARARALHFGVDMPILSQVYNVLFEGTSPQDALRELLLRDLRPESPSPSG